MNETKTPCSAKATQGKQPQTAAHGQNVREGIWDERSKTWIRPSGTVKQGRRPMFKPFETNPAKPQAKQEAPTEAPLAEIAQSDPYGGTWRDPYTGKVHKSKTTEAPTYAKRLANGLELTHAMKLEQQRDELLAACKALISDTSLSNEPFPSAIVRQSGIAKLRAAIAKAEKQ